MGKQLHRLGKTAIAWKAAAAAALCTAWLPSCSKEENVEPPGQEAALQLHAELPFDPAKANAVNFMQIPLPIRQEAFEIPPTDSFSVEYVQPEDNKPLVDILIVIDNSGSMSEEQEKLAVKTKPLLSALHMADWQINVVSTDSPCSTRDYLPLKPDAEDLEDNFYNAIKIGTGGSSTEQPLNMAVQNLKQTGRCGPKAWLRPDAKLAVFILSDEDERTSTVTPDKFIEALAEKDYIVGENAKLFAIMTHPSKPCKTATDAPGGAPIIAELMEKTKSMWGDICASDYSEMLEAASADIAKFFNTSVSLGKVPEGDLTVTLNGQEFNEAGWEIVGDKFILQEALGGGAVVVVSFQSGLTKVLALRTQGLPRDVAVMIDDDKEEMAATAYKFRPQKKTLTFLRPLPVGAKVTVSFKDDSELQSVFPFPRLDNELDIYCYADGDPIPSAYFPGDDVITFSPPPPENARVSCLYE